MIKRSLCDARNRSISNLRSKRIRAIKEEYSDVIATISEILVGAPCYGDDGEDAEIDKVFMRHGVPMIQYTQDDGVIYNVELANYLGAIDIDDNDRKFIENYLVDAGLMESRKIRFRNITAVNESRTRKIQNRRTSLSQRTTRLPRKTRRSLCE